MQLRNIKWVLLFCTVLLIGSIIKDLYGLSQYRSNHILLSNYLSFEKIGLNHKKEILIDRIKTSIAFKSLGEQEELSFIANLEGSSSKELEHQILKMLYQPISTLDSLPYNDDVFQLRNQKKEFNTSDILIFYENLLVNTMLEIMACEVYDDTHGGLLRWKIIRPLTEDSTYIGTLITPDGREKYAITINGAYKPAGTSNVFTIRKTDTLEIITLTMINQGTYIDTIQNAQLIVRKGKGWRNMGK